MIVGPTGCRRYSRDAAIPKLPPPPRTAQNRSAFSSSLTRRTRPSAVTSCTDVRLSRASPYLPISHPIPPPRVRPAIPVLDTTPPVVASPCSWVSRLNSPQVTPPCARAVRVLRIHVDAFHQRQVEHQPAINGGASRHIVTAAPHRDFQVQRARQMHRLDDIGDAAAARDQRRPLVHQAVVDFPGFLVARIGRLQELPCKRLGMLGDSVGQRGC